MRSFQSPERRLYTLLVFAWCLFVLASYTTVSNAQVTGPSAAIDMSQNNPRPYEEVTATLNAYSYNLSGATIRWYVNGVAQVEAENAYTMTFTTGGLGETISLKTIITFPGGSTVPVTRVFSPSNVDIILEGDTSVPVFYRGRALGSTGATMRAVAVSQIKGSPDPKNLFYTWKLGRQMLLGGTAKGANAVTFSLPLSSALLSVEITDASGKQLGGSSITVESTAPEIHFYEQNPLRGLMQTALDGTYALEKEEIIVRAEPYFVSPVRSGGEEGWTLDGRRVAPTDSDLRLLTLRQTGGSGSAKLQYSFANTSPFLQYAQNSFTMLFDDSGITPTQYDDGLLE